MVSYNIAFVPYIILRFIPYYIPIPNFTENKFDIECAAFVFDYPI